MTTNLIASVLAALLAALALHGYLRLRGTTLGAACLWTAFSASCLVLAAVAAPQLEGIGQSALRFALACTTFCPMMAVLGAKRPQSRGWQWIVASLWLVLVWPAAQAALLPAGVTLELFVAWKMFLWGLIAIGLVNYLPTSNWRAAILLALGQILLLRDFLGLPATDSPAVSDLVAILSLLSAAGIVLQRSAANTTRDASLSTLASPTSRWLRIRDLFGAFWALRILGRVNQAAELRDWPMRLSWHGFVPSDNAGPSDDQLAELEQTMDSMLRRFLEVDE
ncbi:MAG: hypothetical protein ACR2NM_00260 [Bythopirellula sp.]